MSTYAEKLVTIGPVLSKIFGEICRFCHIVIKIEICHLVISGVSAPIFIILAHNVAIILPLIILKSKLQYSNPFHNVSVSNKGHLANFAQNWLPWQRPLKNWKNGPIDHLRIDTYHFVKKIVKIGPVDLEIPLLR